VTVRACVLYTEEKMYSVVRLDKIKYNNDDDEDDAFVIENGKSYRVLIITKGTKEKCVRSSKNLEIALQTECDEHEGELGSK
jgi:hypothetical protein